MSNSKRRITRRGVELDSDDAALLALAELRAKGQSASLLIRREGERLTVALKLEDGTILIQ